MDYISNQYRFKIIHDIILDVIVIYGLKLQYGSLTETNLYYCETRYYNHEIYQWISPDEIDYLDYESINGINLYCYCGNNPIIGYDQTGHFILTALIIGVIIGVVVGFGVTIYID